MLREMRDAGVKHNVMSFSAAVRACGKGGQWEEALALLREMREAMIMMMMLMTMMIMMMMLMTMMMMIFDDL